MILGEDVRLFGKTRDVETTPEGSPASPEDDGHPTGRRTIATAVLVGLAVSVLIVAPLAGHGWLILLDWIPGPHPDMPRWLWGLDGALTTSPLLHVGNAVMGTIAGEQTASWLPFALFFPVCFVSMSLLVPGGLAAKTSAGALYALNPLVADRAWVGHFGFLICYALLPLLLRSLLVARDARGISRLRPAIWVACLGSIAPHFYLIGGLLFLIVTIFGHRNRKTVGWAIAFIVAVCAMSLYVLPSTYVEQGGFSVGNADLSAYETRATLPIGLFGSVLMLRGFWRIDELQPTVPDAFLIGACVLMLGSVVCGAINMLRDDNRRVMARVLITTALLSFFLALGTQGPTGFAFRWMFDHVPGFAIMREPQKFAAGLALAYAVFFGAGVEFALQRVRIPVARTFITIMAAVLPFLLAWNMLFAFNRTLEPSHYPSSWYAADKAMGSGQGSVLYFPWHQYASHSFTKGRIVGPLAESFFRRPVIQGDNVELPGLPTSSRSSRSAYIEGLLERGNSIHSFGQLITPLGVEYVVLSKSQDWNRYTWLLDQPDLEKVSETDDLVVLRNDRFQGVGYPIRDVRTVDGLDSLIAWSNRENLSQWVFQLGDADSATFSDGTATSQSTISTESAKQTSNVSYELPRNATNRYALREPYDGDWRSIDTGVSLVSGTMITADGVHDNQVDFALWQRMKVLYALSVISAVALLIACNRRRTLP